MIASQNGNGHPSSSEKLSCILGLLNNEEAIFSALKLANNKKTSVYSDHFEILKILSSLDLHVIKRKFGEAEKTPRVYLKDFISIFYSVVFLDDKNSLLFLTIGLFQLFLGVFQSSQKNMDRLMREFSNEKEQKDGKLSEIMMGTVEKFGFPIHRYILENIDKLWVSFEDFQRYYVNPDNIMHYKKVDTKDMLLISVPKEADVKKRRVEPFKITTSSRADRFGSSIRKVDVIPELNFMLLLEENSDTIRFFNAQTLKEDYLLRLAPSKQTKRRSEITDFCFLSVESLLCASAMNGSLCFWSLDRSYREKEKMNWDLGVYIPIDSRTPVLGNYQFELPTNDNPLSIWYSAKFSLVISTSIYSTINCWCIPEIEELWALEKNFWRDDGFGPQSKHSFLGSETAASPQKLHTKSNLKSRTGIEKKPKLQVIPTSIDIGVNGRITDCVELEKIDCFMFSSYEKKIVIWNYPHSEVFYTLELKLTSAHHVLWIPKQNYIIPCCFDQMLEVHELGNAEEFSLAGRLVGHSYEIVSAMALPDFEMIITVDENSNVRSWSLITFKTTQSFQLESTNRVTQLKRLNQNTFVVVSKNLAFFKIEQGEFGLFDEEESGTGEKDGEQAGSNRQSVIPEICLDINNEGEKRIIVGTSEALMYISLDRECIDKLAGERDWFFKKCQPLSAFSFCNLPYCQVVVGDRHGRVFLVPERTYQLKEKPRVAHPFVTLNVEENQEEKEKSLSDFQSEEKYSEQIDIVLNNQLKYKKGGLTTLKWEANKADSGPDSILFGLTSENQGSRYHRKKKKLGFAEHPRQIFTHLEKQLVTVCGRQSLSVLKMHRFNSLSRLRMVLIKPETGVEIEEVLFLEEMEMFALHLTNNLLLFMCFYTLEVKFAIANLNVKFISDLCISDFSPLLSPNPSNNPNSPIVFPSRFSSEEASAFNSPARKRQNPSFNRRQTLASSPKTNRMDIDSLLKAKTDFTFLFKQIKAVMKIGNNKGSIVFLDEDKNINVAWTAGQILNSKARVQIILSCMEFQRGVAKVTSKCVLEDQKTTLLIYGDSRGCLFFVNISKHTKENLNRKVLLLRPEKVQKDEKDPNFKTINHLGSGKFKDVMKDCLATTVTEGFFDLVEKHSVCAADSLIVETHCEEGIEQIKTELINGKHYLFVLNGNLVLRVLDLSQIAQFIQESGSKFGGPELNDGGYNKREKAKEMLLRSWALIEVNMSLKKIVSWDDHTCRDKFLKTQIEQLKCFFLKESLVNLPKSSPLLSSEDLKGYKKTLGFASLGHLKPRNHEPQIKQKRAIIKSIFTTQQGLLHSLQEEPHGFDPEWSNEPTNSFEVTEFLRKMDEVDANQKRRKQERSFQGIKERVMRGEDSKMKGIVHEVESCANEILSSSMQVRADKSQMQSPQGSKMRRVTRFGGLKERISPFEARNPETGKSSQGSTSSKGRLPSLASISGSLSNQSKRFNELGANSPEKSIEIDYVRQTDTQVSRDSRISNTMVFHGASGTIKNQINIPRSPKTMIISRTEMGELPIWREEFSFSKKTPEISKTHEEIPALKSENKEGENIRKSKGFIRLQELKGAHHGLVKSHQRSLDLIQLFSQEAHKTQNSEDFQAKEVMSFSLKKTESRKKIETSLSTTKVGEIARKDVLKKLKAKMNKAKFAKIPYVQIENDHLK